MPGHEQSGLLENDQQSYDRRGPIAVPFFPTHWQENSNSIFNNEFQLLQKAENQEQLKKIDSTISPELKTKLI